ncbi:MAG: complex I NDUFA9 subunit family protein [Candidatus Lariskella arthropodorum]
MNERDTVTIFGASGFLGRHLISVIAKSGAKINLVTRSALLNNEKLLYGSAGQIVQIKFSDNREVLKNIVSGSSYVVNLIGTLTCNEKELEYANVSVPRKIAEVAKHAKVKRFLHVSTLVGDNLKLKSGYIKSKLKGESAILNELHDAIILRPSLMFDNGSGFLDMIIKLAKFLPIIPVVGGNKFKLQPIYVHDVALCIYNALTLQCSKSVCGRPIAIAGTHIYSIKEIVDIVLKHNGVNRVTVNIPAWLVSIKAFILWKLGLLKITTEHVKIFTANNILSKGENGLYELCTSPTPIHEIL